MDVFKKILISLYEPPEELSMYSLRSSGHMSASLQVASRSAASPQHTHTVQKVWSH